MNFSVIINYKQKNPQITGYKMQLQDPQKAQELEELGSVLKSILDSEGKPMDSYSLNKIYREMECTNIPYRKLNFPTLKSLPTPWPKATVCWGGS